jgi:hypothetical protein
MIKNFFRYFFTALAPFLYFFINDKNKKGLLCFILQLTIVGWIPCIIWACNDLRNRIKIENKIAKEKKQNAASKD